MINDKKIEENKKLLEEFPFLMPRNAWTGKIPDNYDYSYTRLDEVEDGWQMLFLQMCEDIKQPLIDANYLDGFMFSQIKEKYGSLRMYNFGAPDKVHSILMKYEHLSRFVCKNCGAIAEWKSQGWISPYCEKCKENIDKHISESWEKIDGEPATMRITRFTDGKCYEEVIDCSSEWELYKKTRNIYLEKFLQEKGK